MNERIAVNAAEAAELLGISVPVLRQLTRRADFPAVKLGRRWVISVAGLQRWLDEQAGGVSNGAGL